MIDTQLYCCIFLRFSFYHIFPTLIISNAALGTNRKPNVSDANIWLFCFLPFPPSWRITYPIYQIVKSDMNFHFVKTTRFSSRYFRQGYETGIYRRSWRS